VATCLSLTLSYRRRELKSYDKFKVKIEAIQQQLSKAKKNERANVPKQVNYFCKEFGFTDAMIEGFLIEAGKQK
jgi:hypothetical protein